MVVPGDELVEVVDERGVPVRVVRRAEMRAGNLRHRNVGVVVRRPAGEVVVHQRADWKDVHPGLWDLAFAGVPIVGEADIDTAVREVGEEAGLVVDPTALVELGTASFRDDHTDWVGHFYTVVTGAALSPSDGEVAAMREVPGSELAAWATSTPVCPDIGPVLELVLGAIG